MSNKSGWMVAFVGAGYLALGLLLVTYHATVENTNIDLRLIPNFVFAITISSLLFAFSDFLEQFFIEARRNKNLRKIKVADVSTEQELYELMAKQQNQNFNLFEKFLLKAIYWLYCAAFAVGVVFVFFKYIPCDVILTGLTITSFGIVIATYGFREVKRNEKQMIISNLTTDFYKTKYTENKEVSQ